jgi:hypothetical protein
VIKKPKYRGKRKLDDPATDIKLDIESIFKQKVILLKNVIE